MSGTRQKTRCKPTQTSIERSEAPNADTSGAEPSMAKPAPESPAATAADHLMEEVCERENLQRAWQRVRRNKGAPGPDGMTIDDAKSYLREHWPDIRSRLLEGDYQPQPVKRVEIPKPDGGVRKLGVPSVVDRLIQQALLQVLQEQWDPTFSEHSYGFRPGRSAHQAVAQAQRYIADGAIPPAQPLDGDRPRLVRQRFACHAILESDLIPRRKKIKLARMGMRLGYHALGLEH